MGSKGGSNQTSTTQSSSSPPPQVMADYQALVNRAANNANTPYQQYPGELVAPLSNQTAAGLGNVNSASGAAQPFYNAAAAGTIAAANPISPTQFSGQQVGQYMSPYTQNVVDATQNQFNNQNQQAAQFLNSQNISSGAFGGDRAGVSQGILANQQQTAQSPVIAGLYNQDYNQALQEFNTQQGVGLQSQAFNRQNTGQMANQLAGIGTQDQSSALQGAMAQIQAGEIPQQEQQAVDTALYNQYQQQQQYPFQTTGWLGNLVEGTGSLSGGTSTSQTSTPVGNSGSSALGAGLSGLGILGSFLSDKEAKENVKPVGKTFDGQTIYRYNYKGDPRTQIGLIAQETEKHHPDAVHFGGGMRAVNYDDATRDSAKRGHFAMGGASLDTLPAVGSQAATFATLGDPSARPGLGAAGLMVGDRPHFGGGGPIVDTTSQPFFTNNQFGIDTLNPLAGVSNNIYNQVTAGSDSPAFSVDTGVTRAIGGGPAFTKNLATPYLQQPGPQQNYPALDWQMPGNNFQTAGAEASLYGLENRPGIENTPSESNAPKSALPAYTGGAGGGSGGNGGIPQGGVLQPGTMAALGLSPDNPFAGGANNNLLNSLAGTPAAGGGGAGGSPGGPGGGSVGQLPTASVPTAQPPQTAAPTAAPQGGGGQLAYYGTDAYNKALGSAINSQGIGPANAPAGYDAMLGREFSFGTGNGGQPIPIQVGGDDAGAAAIAGRAAGGRTEPPDEYWPSNGDRTDASMMAHFGGRVGRAAGGQLGQSGMAPVLAQPPAGTQVAQQGEGSYGGDAGTGFGSMFGSRPSFALGGGADDPNDTAIGSDPWGHVSTWVPSVNLTVSGRGPPQPEGGGKSPGGGGGGSPGGGDIGKQLSSLGDQAKKLGILGGSPSSAPSASSAPTVDAGGPSLDGTDFASDVMAGGTSPDMTGLDFLGDGLGVTFARGGKVRRHFDAGGDVPTDWMDAPAIQHPMNYGPPPDAPDSPPPNLSDAGPELIGKPGMKTPIGSPAPAAPPRRPGGDISDDQIDNLVDNYHSAPAVAAINRAVEPVAGGAAQGSVDEIAPGGFPADRRQTTAQQRADFIRSYVAQKYPGKDPSVALGIAKAEGLGVGGLGPSGVDVQGGQPFSFGDYQMNIHPGALGDQARKAGYDPTNPNQWKQVDQFAIDQMYGGKGYNVGPWKGDPYAANILRGGAPGAVGAIGDQRPGAGGTQVAQAYGSDASPIAAQVAGTTGPDGQRYFSPQDQSNPFSNKRELFQAMMYAGFAMMGGESRNAMVNIGRGGMAGAEYLQKQTALDRDWIEKQAQIEHLGHEDRRLDADANLRNQQWQIELKKLQIAQDAATSSQRLDDEEMGGKAQPTPAAGAPAAAPPPSSPLAAIGGPGTPPAAPAPIPAAAGAPPPVPPTKGVQVASAGPTPVPAASETPPAAPQQQVAQGPQAAPPQAQGADQSVFSAEVQRQQRILLQRARIADSKAAIGDQQAALEADRLRQQARALPTQEQIMVPGRGVMTNPAIIAGKASIAGAEATAKENAGVAPNIIEGKGKIAGAEATAKENASVAPNVIQGKGAIAGAEATARQQAEVAPDIAAGKANIKQKETAAEEGTKQVFDEDKSMNGAGFSLAQQGQRLEALKEIMQRWQPGAWQDHIGDIQNILHTLGLSEGDSASAATEFLKNSTGEVFDALKEQRGQVRNMEIQGLSKSNPNVTSTPEANAEIISQLLGTVRARQAMAKDWADWRSTPDGQAATSPLQFTQKWLQDPNHQISKYVDQERRNFAYSGQKIPDKPSDGQHYFVPGKGEYVWSGSKSKFVRPNAYQPAAQ